jgi:predicted metal-binding protein
VIEIESAGHTIAQATVLVCVTCRNSNDPPDALLSGWVLAKATADAAVEHPGISVHTVRCLGNCSRGPSAAILSKQAWTYVFGGLAPKHDGPALIAGARLLASASDGLMPWRDRPEPLKRGLIARVPPVNFAGELTGHSNDVKTG